ncbi:MAG: dATP/dGTP pyrophosphohydrolase domain-containing protein, partial [Patescibacteria group bacterium]
MMYPKPNEAEFDETSPLSRLFQEHLSAMTGEGLHAKSDIAWQLAARDLEILRLRESERAFLSLAEEQAEWSQRTFGTDAERGPTGPLEHLAEEACEAIQNPSDVTEYADCLLLVLDAARRARFCASALLAAACEKLAVNKQRT